MAECSMPGQFPQESVMAKAQRILPLNLPKVPSTNEDKLFLQRHLPQERLTWIGEFLGKFIPPKNECITK